MILSNKFKPFFELLSDDPVLIEKHKDVRYVILWGGRGGAKSTAVNAWVNPATYKDKWGIYFTRWTMKSAEKSIIPEFEKVSNMIGNAGDFSFKRTQVVNNVSGCVIDYSGLKPQSNQSSGDSKSLAKKNVFIVEEAEDVQNFDLFDKTDNSIRTIDAKNLVILCLNQGSVHHWIYKEFIKEKRDDVMEIVITYKDNKKYLDKGYLNKIRRVKERDLRRYNHIYGTTWKTDTDGALWRDGDISPYRISKQEYDELDISEVVVGFDPSVTDVDKAAKERMAQTGNEPDEDGIVVAARCKEGRYYILADYSMRGTRTEVAKKVIDAYHQWQANSIVVEKNNGGDWIPTVIRGVDKSVYVKTVHASRGKKVRAEPIVVKYQDGEVSHIGYKSELELEMTSWIPDAGMPSPNRIDAMVWAITKLIKKREIQVF